MSTGDYAGPNPRKVRPPHIPYAQREQRPAHIKSVTTLRTKNGARLCGGLLLTPGSHGDWLCHIPGMRSNGRCKRHGGKALAGYSNHTKKLSPRTTILKDLGLLEQFEEFRTDPQLAELHRELALVDVEISRSLRRLKAEDTAAHRREYLAAINAKRKLSDSVHKNTASVVPVERVFAFLQAMINLTLQFVTDPRQKAIYLQKVKELTGRHQNPGPVAPEAIEANVLESAPVERPA